MRSNETTLLIPLVIALAVQLVITLGLRVWGRWVARRQGGVWWHRASWMPPAALVVATFGVAGTVIELVRVFGQVQAVNVEHRAQALADGISGAMIFTAVCVPAANLLYIASFVAFLVGSVRTVPSRA